MWFSLSVCVWGPHRHSPIEMCVSVYTKHKGCVPTFNSIWYKNCLATGLMILRYNQSMVHYTFGLTDQQKQHRSEPSWSTFLLSPNSDVNSELSWHQSSHSCMVHTYFKCHYFSMLKNRKQKEQHIWNTFDRPGMFKTILENEHRQHALLSCQQHGFHISDVQVTSSHVAMLCCSKSPILKPRGPLRIK